LIFFRKQNLLVTQYFTWRFYLYSELKDLWSRRAKRRSSRIISKFWFWFIFVSSYSLTVNSSYAIYLKNCHRCYMSINRPILFYRVNGINGNFSKTVRNEIESKVCRWFPNEIWLSHFLYTYSSFHTSTSLLNRKFYLNFN